MSLDLSDESREHYLEDTDTEPHEFRAGVIFLDPICITCGELQAAPWHMTEGGKA
jgi:hypothetical protein